MDSTSSIKLVVDQATEQENAFLQVLHSRIMGQEGGKKAAARAYRRSLNVLRNRRGPLYRILQIGKSRTGKTLTAESSALALHGDAEALVYVNCEHFKQSHQIQQLLGAPPSYVGYKDPKEQEKAKPGQVDPSALFSRANLIASRKGSAVPVTIVLLDEIEKASPEFLDVLLGIFDKGKIRLANNSDTDFTDCIFFMTSNLAMEEVEKLSNPIGFRTREQEVTEKEIGSIVKQALKRRFRPEFLKRIDEVVIFAPLTQAQLEGVVELEIKLLKDRIRQHVEKPRRFAVKVEEPARRFILKVALADNGGVAEIKHVIDTRVSDVLGNELAKGTIRGGDLVVVDHVEGEEALSFLLHRGEADPSELEDLETPAPGAQKGQSGARNALPAPNATARETLTRLRELCATKLVDHADSRSKTEKSIIIGPELKRLVAEMGHRTAGWDWDKYHLAIFEADAYQLFWSKIQSTYWYWALLQGCLNAASELPIDIQDVRQALLSLRKQEGVVNDYNLQSNTVVARLAVKGLLLLHINPESQGEELHKNRIFD